MKDDILNVVIIGGGPAGFTSAIYTARANLKPLIFTGTLGEGEIFLATDIDDFPGFPQGITGIELMNLMNEQAEKYGVDIINKKVKSVDFSNIPYVILDEDNNKYKTKSVIIATGGIPRWLGLDKEKELVGKGVSVCAVCDGAFFKDKIVAVVGGGDVALEDALYLSKISQKVYLIHRRNELRAASTFQEEARKTSNIQFILNSQVIKLIGDKKLEKIIVQNNETKEEMELTIDGLFLAIGFDPNTALFKDQLEIDEKGYLKVIDNVKTSKEGIFAAGDVCDSRYRQVVTASGFGAMAAIEAEKWLRQQHN